jgi:hypothetical protein
MDDATTGAAVRLARRIALALLLVVAALAIAVIWSLSPDELTFAGLVGLMALLVYPSPP